MNCWALQLPEALEVASAINRWCASAKLWQDRTGRADSNVYPSDTEADLRPDFEQVSADSSHLSRQYGSVKA